VAHIIPMPTHPVHQPGFTGALLNALQLLPVGRLDGGRLATAALGQGSHLLVSIVPGVVVTAATSPHKVAVCMHLRHAATSSPGGLGERRHGPYPIQPGS
jgi:membrane-associated protease RseP (regulator of RpoE activity)